MAVLKIVKDQQGKKVTTEDEKSLAHKVLQESIDQELIYQKGRSMNITIAPETIDAEIKQIRDQFPNKELFLTALAFQHLTVDLLRSKIEKKLTEEEFIRKEIASQVKLKEGAAEKFYNENKKKFQKPEFFEIAQIYVESLSPSEGKVSDPAQQKKADRLKALIQEKAKAKIERVLKELKSGKKFSDLAKQYSEDERTKDKGGYLGMVTRSNTVSLLANAMVKLKEGETSEIIETGHGFHILKLIKKHAPAIAEFSEVQSDIMNFLLKEKVEAFKKKYIDTLRKQSDIKTFL